jgi:V-type H+-transporting ATPase subunit a
MFLSPGNVEKGTELYRGQGTVQMLLVLIAVIQVPILLFLKPFYLRWEHNRARAKGYRGIGETSRVSALDGQDDDDSNTLDGRASLASDGEGVAMITQDIGEDEHEEFEFSEVMIHQVIHTIGKPNNSKNRAPAKNHRILLELCVPHSVLPTLMGSITCSSATFNRALVYDLG